MRNFIIGIFAVMLSGCGGGFKAANFSSSGSNDVTSTLCTPNAQQSCPIGNGTGSQACNSSGFAWGACGNLTSCNSGYNLQNGVCVANVCTPNAQQSCQAGNGTGSQTCNTSGSAWGACGNLTSCNSGYNLQNGVCVANVCSPNTQQSCQTGNGTGAQTCNSSGSTWGTCGNLTSCNSGYTLADNSCISNAAVLANPIGTVGKYFFVPNQNAASWWNPANGNIEGSFSNFSLWPNLMNNLVSNRGGFGIYSPEISAITDATLLAMRMGGLPIEVEPPGMTQCADGATIADAELNGANNSIGQEFKIVGQGWFVTSNGTAFVPDEIIMDERIPQRVLSPCPGAQAESVPSLISDYVQYSQAMRTKWPANTPHFSLWWNVVPEWAEESVVLNQLVQALCNSGQCPTTVYVDVDWTMEPQSLISILTNIKTVLNANGVGFGVGLAGDAHGITDDLTSQETADKSGLTLISCPGCSENELFQNTELNIIDWLIHEGIVDGNTRIHIQSWQTSPQEVGSQVAETIPYSLANTANRIFNEELILGGLAASPFNPQVGGPFQVGASIYEANSAQHYCGFIDQSYFTALTGRSGNQTVPSLTAIPSGFIYDGACLPANQLFAVDSGVYAENAMGHYCGFSSWNSYVALTGKTDLSGVLNLDQLPPAIYDGACQ